MADFTELPDLASERLGAAVLWANDDYFAAKENLILATAPVWKEHEYTERGKWMDGWESRRKRTPGFDSCIVRLGAPGIIRGLVVDTSFFRGNFPESCSVQGCNAAPETPVEDLLGPGTVWHEVLSRSALRGDSENRFDVSNPTAFTHLRLDIFPDGGVARLRVHGEVIPDWRRHGGLRGEVDLASIELGAEVLACSDMFFGPKHNLIMPGRAKNMSDGWETRRRRGPGHDWVVVRLATEGVIRRVELDTNHFKGNFPDTASLEACRTAGDPADASWVELLPRTKLMAHTRHVFRDALRPAGAVTHVRLNVFPDGGISRLRVWGTASDAGRRAQVARYLDSLAAEQRAKVLFACCASKAWASRVTSAAPYGSWERLVDVTTDIWTSMGEAEWLEAFAAHPRIGERRAESSTFSKWSSEEQSKIGAAARSTLEAIEDGNRAYEERFGFVFLVCATGKSADEILTMLNARLGHDRAIELRIAAEEQRRITELRLDKLVC